MSQQIMTTELEENRQLLDQQRVLEELVGRSAFDRVLRQRLLSEPKTVLAEHGIVFPEGFTVQCIENGYDTTIVLPDAIDEIQELSQDDLLAVNGGAAAASALSAVTKTLSVTTGACIGASLSVIVTVISITVVATN